jgi:dTDP-4-amino-4,6-dideoxygalactose transaminase
MSVGPFLSRPSPDRISVYGDDGLLVGRVWVEGARTSRCSTPIPLQPVFADLGPDARRFPVAETLAGELLALPIRPCMPDGEIAYVTATVGSSRTS